MRIDEMFNEKDKRWMIEYETDGNAKWGYRLCPYAAGSSVWISNVRDSWSYIDKEPGLEDTWYEVPYTSHGDYHGSAVEESNLRCLKDLAKQLGAEDFLTVVLSGHGGESLFIRADCDCEDLLDTIASLENYPAVDDEDLCELEREREDEAWESWVRGDFHSELLEAFGLRYSFDWPDDIDEPDATDDELRSLFYVGMDRSNTYWTHETGDSVYVDLDRVVKVINLDELPQSWRDTKDKLDYFFSSDEQKAYLDAVAEEIARNNDPNQLKFDFGKEEA